LTVSGLFISDKPEFGRNLKKASKTPIEEKFLPKYKRVLDGVWRFVP
jgi:hypothetical protein